MVRIPEPGERWTGTPRGMSERLTALDNVAVLPTLVPDAVLVEQRALICS